MTTPKGWDTAEAARLHEYGWLHSLSCERDDDGELVCVCTPARVREIGYTSMVGVSDESDTVQRDPGAPAYSRTPGSSRTSSGEIAPPGVRR